MIGIQKLSDVYVLKYNCIRYYHTFSLGYSNYKLILYNFNLSSFTLCYSASVSKELGQEVQCWHCRLLIKLLVSVAMDPDTLDQYCELVHVTVDSRARFAWCFYYTVPMLHAYEFIWSGSYVRILRNKCTNDTIIIIFIFIILFLFFLSVNQITCMRVIYITRWYDDFMQNVAKYLVILLIYFWNLV